MKISLFVFIACALLASASIAQKTPLTGERIIAKMIGVYANAKSYQDTGFIQRIPGPRDESTIERINTFKTFYVRPNKFRFEWTDNLTGRLTSNIVWSNGREYLTYYSSIGVEKEKNLGMLIAGATGVSMGAAYRIPSLLTKALAGFQFTQMSRISLLRDEDFEGEACFVVRGYHPFGFPIDLWIGKKDFLVRKIREANEDESFDEDIRREIKLNGSIADDIFQYKPEKRAS